MSTHPTLDSANVSGGDGDTPLAQLTAKETQVLLWCFKGKTSWEIAKIQNCSESTVNFHFSNIRRKYSVSSRNAALLKAIEAGTIAFDKADPPRGSHEPD